VALVSVPNFDPARSGFSFPNTFAAVPTWRLAIPLLGEFTLGNAANGLCGGMVFAAADFHTYQMPTPADATPPRAGSLFTYIGERLLASFDLPLGPARYYDWMRSDDAAVAARTREAWPVIKAALDAGKVTPLGVVRTKSDKLEDLKVNHQVLAYGYEIDASTGALALAVYDPNYPGQAVTFSCNLNPGPFALTSSHPGLVRGFFATPYFPRDPRFLMRAQTPARSPLSWLGALLSGLRGLLGLR
jgi:hypothetical protein